MKKIFFMVILALGLTACGGNRHHMTLNDERGFDTAWDGGEKRLKIIGNDRPFMLFFFTSTCGACKEQIPVLDAISRERGVRVIGVLGDGAGFDRDMETLREKGVSFPTTSDKKSVAYFANIAGGVMGTPLTLVFDADGRLAKTFLGFYPRSAFENALKLAAK